MKESRFVAEYLDDQSGYDKLMLQQQANYPQGKKQVYKTGGIHNNYEIYQGKHMSMQNKTNISYSQKQLNPELIKSLAPTNCNNYYQGSKRLFKVDKLSPYQRA